MKRPWCPALMAALVSGVVGCAQADRRPSRREVDRQVDPLSIHPPRLPIRPRVSAAASDPDPIPPELTGPQPVDAFIRRALAENRTVQAAFHNVQSLKHRIPQVTALDDPVASNTVFPIPSVAPQYSLMGYNPYNLTLAQQFPWFGTLRLRGEVADRDVRVALAELAVAQLDAVDGGEAGLLRPVRGREDQRRSSPRTAGSWSTSATSPGRGWRLGGSQQDVIRAETLISELDRTLAGNQQEIATARAALARQVHASPEADLQTLPELPIGRCPGRDRAALPVGRDRATRTWGTPGGHRPRREGRRVGPQAVLPQHHARPDLHGHGEDQRRDAQDGQRHAQHRPVRRLQPAGLPRQVPGRCVRGARASRRRCQALRGRAGRDQQRDQGLLHAGQGPATTSWACSATASCPASSIRWISPRPTTRTKTSISRRSCRSSGRCSKSQIQIAQVEAELGKALASLERAVGCEVNERTLERPPAEEGVAAPSPPPCRGHQPLPAGPTPCCSWVGTRRDAARAAMKPHGPGRRQ